MKSAFLLTSSERGVFLGLVYLPKPTGVWSIGGIFNDMPLGAVVFATAESAYRFADQFETPPQGLEVVRCVADIVWDNGQTFASREQCVRLGYKTWLTQADDVANSIPC